MRLQSSENGSSLLEFSLVLPVICLLFLGVVDFGLAIGEDMTVVDAARAGAYWGTLQGNGEDVTGMQAQAAAAAGSLPGFQAVASRWCTCTPGGSVSSCTTWCGTDTPLKYVEVQTRATVPVLAGYPGIPSSFALSGTAVLRIQ